VASDSEVTTSSMATSDTFQKTSISGSDSSNQIAIIRLTGVIGYSVYGEAYESMVDDIVAQLKKARSDKNVKAVLIRIDSPGGEVTASDVIYNAIKQTDEVKPVLVYMDSVAASGGYYSAVGGRYLMANATTITGSIGVIIQSFNFAQATDKLGINVLTLTSGDMKDLLNPFRAAKPEEVEYVQNLINESYDRFLNIVADEREMDADALKNGVADGRIMSGVQAVKDGLIDETGYFEDAIEKIKEIAELEENAQVFKYEAVYSFGRFLRLFNQSILDQGRVEVTVSALSGLPQLSPGRPYYLSPHLWTGTSR
ncbi:MAG: signal peptide peptidase SppA, partial [Verrucomicrobiota bacterium]